MKYTREIKETVTAKLLRFK